MSSSVSLWVSHLHRFPLSEVRRLDVSKTVHLDSTRNSICLPWFLRSSISVIGMSVISESSTHSKSLNTSTDIIIYSEINGDIDMATFTLSAPQELEELKKKYPKVDWNEVIKQGILRRLEELKKFEELKKRGAL